MGKNPRGKNKSLCEKSTEIASNVVMFSSLYLARMSLGSLVTRDRRPLRGGHAEPPPPSPAAAFSQADKSKRLMEPKLRSPTSYLTSAAGEEEDGVDAKAAKFIHKMHDRIGSDPSVRSEVSNCIPPPPPPQRKWATSYSR